MRLFSSKDKYTDEQLAKLVAREDHKAFEVLYDRYNEKVFTYFLRASNDRDLANDLLQDLFQTFWEKAYQFNPKYAFKPWFYTIGSNILRKHYRQPIMVDIEGERIEEVEEDTPVSILADKESDAKIHWISEQLPEHVREVFWLRIIEEFSVKEVAEIVQIPEGTVKSRLHKAIQLVQSMYEKKSKSYA